MVHKLNAQMSDVSLPERQGARRTELRRPVHTIPLGSVSVPGACVADPAPCHLTNAQGALELSDEGARLFAEGCRPLYDLAGPQTTPARCTVVNVDIVARFWLVRHCCTLCSVRIFQSLVL